MREELVFRNVARLVDLPQYERKTIHPWNIEQASQFIAAASGHRWEVGYLLLLLYGMRRGEVLGVRWSDIDFDANVIHVRQQLQRVEGVLLPGPVKTNAGRRTIPMLSEIRAALMRRAALDGIDLEAIDLTAPTPDPLLILTARNGRPVDPKNFVRSFHDIRTKAKLPRITVHHTRHTAATLLKGLGVQAREAQLILGHSNVMTTQQIYQHADVTLQRRALEQVERALIPASGSAGLDDDQSGTRSCHPLLSDGSENIEGPSAQGADPKKSRRPTGVETAAFLGGSGGARTLDTLLKSLSTNVARSLPTSVIYGLHNRAKAHIVGRVAVNRCCQSVASIVQPGTGFDDLRLARDLYASALTAALRARSFPFNLVNPSAINRTEPQR